MANTKIRLILHNHVLLIVSFTLLSMASFLKLFNLFGSYKIFITLKHTFKTLNSCNKIVELTRLLWDIIDCLNLTVSSRYLQAMYITLHKKWSFPLRISSVNVTKSSVSCGFGHIYWRNSQRSIQPTFLLFLKPWWAQQVFKKLRNNLLNFLNFRPLWNVDSFDWYKRNIIEIF